MPVYGDGECIYDPDKECTLGGKGIVTNPIYCLTCAVLKLAESVKSKE